MRSDAAEIARRFSPVTISCCGEIGKSFRLSLERSEKRGDGQFQSHWRVEKVTIHDNILSHSQVIESPPQAEYPPLANYQNNLPRKRAMVADRASVPTPGS